MILGFAGPVSSAFSGGKGDGHYDQHSKQNYISKNAAAVVGVHLSKPNPRMPQAIVVTPRSALRLFSLSMMESNLF